MPPKTTRTLKFNEIFTLSTNSLPSSSDFEQWYRHWHFDISFRGANSFATVHGQAQASSRCQTWLICCSSATHRRPCHRSRSCSRETLSCSLKMFCKICLSGWSTVVWKGWELFKLLLIVFFEILEICSSKTSKFQWNSSWFFNILNFNV